MKLSVIIVNYNVKFYLEQCLLSVFKATKNIATEVFVVDNHSRDGSVDYLTDRFPSVNIISSNHNLGFARANNVAIRQCSGDYVLLLNPDTIVGENALDEVVAFMDAHPKAGGVGVCMLKVDGTPAMESRRGFPTPLTAFYKMSGLCARFPKSRRFGHYYMGYLPWSSAEKIEVISGAFCMVRHEALDKIGLLDEDFFMYGEDIDLSYRLLKGGYENWYVPARILHYKGESTHKSSFAYVHVFYDAMFIFFRKHYGHLSLLFSVPVKGAILVKATAALFKMLIGRVRKSLGFFSRNRVATTSYVFIGCNDALERCRKIARKKGLDATFCEGTAESLPRGHVDMPMPKGDVVAVYDVGSYSYEQIFDIFASDENKGVGIGTFDKSTGTIITCEEVLR